MKQILIALFVICFLVSCKDENQTHSKTQDSNHTEEQHSKDKNHHSEDHANDKASKPNVLKKSTANLKKELTEKGFQVFDYVDEKTQDTIIMQRYYIAFLKTGPIRNQNEEEAAQLQEEHLEHLGKMYELGYADISGPFDDEGDIRGITIYNVPTQHMADSLANSDPAVKAGRLQIEIHPWWAAKGFALR
ncbi:hypothetical protein RM697_04820 [Ichthyenterobacterium sp. W332]|uniref:YCII-related domain-containing protein n=1 Tax=Microcosmobacter mediterraneus TaxID=3075607 RepID=A0ABU2YJG9_9FLAO|nr:YciI family protein [Ichthyenterobacterium sp. W332]MDT0557955.1 hypothetical protein [Ichthyenterobacterium sp. W332]